MVINRVNVCSPQKKKKRGDQGCWFVSTLNWFLWLCSVTHRSLHRGTHKDNKWYFVETLSPHRESLNPNISLVFGNVLSVRQKMFDPLINHKDHSFTEETDSNLKLFDMKIWNIFTLNWWLCFHWLHLFVQLINTLFKTTFKNHQVHQMELFQDLHLETKERRLHFLTYF